MPKNLTTLVLPFLLSLSAPAQQPPTKPPIFKSKSELVLIPAIVTAHGSPMRGLSRDDFTIMRNGNKEAISVFEEIDAVPAQMLPVSLPPRTVQNFAPGDSHQDIVILVLNFIGTDVYIAGRTRAFLKEIAEQFAKEHTPVTLLLLTKDGLSQVHSFTSDPQELLKAVEQWTSNVRTDHGPATEIPPAWSSPVSLTSQSISGSSLDRFANIQEDYIRRDESKMTLHAAEQIASAFRGIPGRKKLIWVGPEFIPVPNDATGAFQASDWEQELWRSLSDANIAVYPVDSKSVVNPTWGEYFSPEHTASQMSSRPADPLLRPFPLSNMLLVAQKTAGQYCDLKPDVCVERDQHDGNHYYMLGFYLHGEQKPGWNSLKISVNQPDASVRAREGFVPGPTAPPSAIRTSAQKAAEKDIVLTALSAPLDYTAVPLRLSWAPAVGKASLELHLVSPPGGIVLDPDKKAMNLDYLAFIRPMGKTEGQSFPATLAMQLNAQQQAELAKNGFSYRKDIPVAPGKYEVKVFLRDNVSGKTGTVSTVVEIPSS